MIMTKAEQIKLMADQEYIDYKYGLFSQEEIEEAIRDKKRVKVRKVNKEYNSYRNECIDTAKPEIWRYVKRTADL